MLKVLIDKDSTVQYEKGGILSKIIEIFVVPVFNSRLFDFFTSKFIYTSKNAAEVKKHATTSKALEIMYAFDGRFHWGYGFFDSLITYFLQHLINPMALRNRLKLVKKELKRYILKIPKSEIKILNLGSGSARGILEVAQDLKNKKLSIMLVDKNSEALVSSRALANSLGIIHKIQYVQDNINNMDIFAQDFHPDIVEMVGIMDYLTDEKAVLIFNKVFALMKRGGVFIMGNVRENKETPFVKNVMRWPLIYREPNDLKNIILKTKFDPRKTKIIYEPLKVHGIIIAEI